MSDRRCAVSFWLLPGHGGLLWAISRYQPIEYISDEAKIPARQKYILVQYGNKNALERHARGLTYSIDQSLSKNLLEAHTETLPQSFRVLRDIGGP